MSLNEEFKNILTDTERFLKQQRELFGDTIFVSKNDLLSADTKQNSPSVNKAPVALEIDLFGNATKTITGHHKTGEPILPQFPNESWTGTKSLDELNNAINACMKCGLGKTRIKFVFGVGNPKADVVVVGEAPGADEDEKGEPFVGRAGQLLNKILEAVQFKREEVFICNILKCRPPNNRDPQTDEIDCCEPYLWKQLEILKPKMIHCAGRIAGQSL
jgi:hypothetical protein